MKNILRNLKKFDLILLAALAILIAGFILSGYLYVTSYEKEFTASVAQKLSAISELKAGELVQWRKERLNDVAFFYQDSEFSSLVKKYLSNTNDRNAENRVRLVMSKVYSIYEYDAVFLLDKKYSKKIVVSEGQERIFSYVSQKSMDSISAGKVAFEDFYYNEQNKKIYLKILIPIFDEEKKNDLIGIVALRIDPDDYLYPLIQRWPSESKTGETLLIRREGNDVVFVNRLRFNTNATLTLRFDIEKNKELPAAKAVTGKKGITAGIDYRGVKVMADVRAIPNSPWFIVTKMDQSEIYYSYYERQWIVGIAILLLVLSSVMSIGFSLKQNRVKNLRVTLETERALRKSEKNLSITLNSIGDGVISTDVDGNVMQINPVAEKLCGWSFAEARGKSLLEVFNIVNAETRQFVANPVTLALEIGGIVGLGNHTVLIARDGNEYQIADSAAPIRDEEGKIIGVVLVFSDITEKYKMETELRESEEKYRGLVENSPNAIAIYVNGKIVFVNNESLRLLAAKTREELIGKPIIKFVHPDNRAAVMQRMKEMAIDGKPLPTVEEKIIRLNGTTVDVEAKAIPTIYNHKPAVQIIVHDISERKLAERASRQVALQLAKSEMRLHAIIDAEPECVKTSDANGTLLSMNRAGLEMIEADTQEQVVGKSMLPIIVPEYRKAYLNHLSRVCGGEKEIIQYEIVGLKGTRRWMETHSVPLIDEHGQNNGMLAITRDITKSKQVLEALRESEETFRHLFEESADPILLLDDSGFTDCNKATILLLGYASKDEFLNKQPWELSPERQPDGMLSTEKAKLMIETASQQGYNRFEWIHTKSDGTHFPVEVMLTPIILKGEIFFYTVWRDITERKLAEKIKQQTEERFRNVVDSTEGIVWEADAQTFVFSYVSKQAERLLGFSIEEWYADGFWADHIHPEDKEVTVQFCISQTKQMKAHDFVYRFVAKNGRAVWLRDIVTVVVENGMPQLLRGLMIDITQQKETEDALRNAQKMESIGTLAGGIAHDFNNLLAAILGQSSLALSKLPKESPAASNITKAINASERAADLTRQLLAYSGRGKFFTVEIDLNTLVSENIQMLEVSIPKTTQLRYEFGSPSPHIIGDLGQIQQVIMNLIINAGEAIGQNPGYINLLTSRIEITEKNTEYWKYTNAPLAPGSYALIQVRDNGSGISDETLNRIFDPFFTTKFMGRGLGLAAVLGIIRGHNGGLRIESEEGKGTMFEIVLPLVSASPMTDVPEKKEASVMKGEGKTILIIDDDPFVFQLLEDILTEVHFTVIGASDPLQGIEIYRREHQTIAMVILDFSMPNMNGKEAFEKLVQINKEVKVLLCSGYTEEETLSTFGTIRPTGFFQKPYRADALVEWITRMI